MQCLLRLAASCQSMRCPLPANQPLRRTKVRKVGRFLTGIGSRHHDLLCGGPPCQPIKPQPLSRLEVAVAAMILAFLGRVTFPPTPRAIGAIVEEVNVATRRLLTPDQISAQPQAEWGRTPTVQEVAAIQQMLANREDEATLNAGI
jgi:hypothetical protein